MCNSGQRLTIKLLLCFHVNQQVSTLSCHTFFNFYKMNIISHLKELPLETALLMNRVENNVAKGEMLILNTLLLPHCFQKPPAADVSKMFV